MKPLIAWVVAIFLVLGVSVAGAQTLVPVTLDGTKSFDPNDDPLTYEWYVYAQPIDFGSEDPIATGVTPTLSLAPGIHRFILLVCDRPAGDPDILCDVDDVTIRVNEPNLAPTADAGPDQVVQILRRGHVNVALNGTDSQGADLSYRWVLRDKIVGVTSQPTVWLVQGSHLIWLDVENDAGADSDYLIVTVKKKRG